MDPLGKLSQDLPMRVFTHINKLDDCFGQFLVTLICDFAGARQRTRSTPVAHLVSHAHGHDKDRVGLI